MNDQTREQLLGYLLGALEDGEREEIEQRLAEDAEYREELEQLATRLEPLAESFVERDPPPGLASRTFATIVRHCSVGLASASRHEAGRGPWTIADTVVAAGICLAAAFLFFPAIAQSRFEARVMACQNNLRELGLALVDYSEKAGQGHFPEIPASGKCSIAGIYGSKLLGAGYPVGSLLLCPSSPLAHEPRRLPLPPTEEALERAQGGELAALQRVAGGSYGYTLGNVRDGEYGPTKNCSRSHFVIMADTPDASQEGSLSRNHEGRGQNLLYEDGAVRFVCNVKAVTGLDHPFQNRLGLIEAGVDVDDAVVAPSATPPFARLRAVAPVLLPR